MARKKKREKKRQKPLIKKRAVSSIFSFMFKLIPVFLALALVAGGVKLAASWFINSSYFKVNTIRVIGEIEGSVSGDVESDLSSKKGVNIFLVNLKECEYIVGKKHPELKDLRVRRALPDVIEVSYQVRRPFFQVESGYFYLVSDDLVVFPKHKAVADPGLPIVTGIDISEKSLTPERRSGSKALKKALSLLKEIKASSFSNEYNVVKIDVYDPRNPSIYIEDGTRIEIGEQSFRQKERLLKKVLDDLRSKDKKAKVIDLRFKDVVVTPI
jgi:cell division septal protein FtsQ